MPGTCSVTAYASVRDATFLPCSLARTPHQTPSAGAQGRARRGAASPPQAAARGQHKRRLGTG
eukprot:3835759-Pleurochrysis_carterae.AAC.4